jgi:hypothetical protein
MHSKTKKRRSRLRPQHLAYSIELLTEVTGVSRQVIYDEIKRGRLISRKLGRRTIVTRSDALKWLQALPQARPSAAAD